MKHKMNIDLAIRYIKEKINKAEKKRFESWLNESDVNFYQFIEFKKYWELSGNSVISVTLSDIHIPLQEILIMPLYMKFLVWLNRR